MAYDWIHPHFLGVACISRDVTLNAILRQQSLINLISYAILVVADTVSVNVYIVTLLLTEPTFYAQTFSSGLEAS